MNSTACTSLTFSRSNCVRKSGGVSISRLPSASGSGSSNGFGCCAGRCFGKHHTRILWREHRRWSRFPKRSPRESGPGKLDWSRTSRLEQDRMRSCRDVIAGEQPRAGEVLSGEPLNVCRGVQGRRCSSGRQQSRSEGRCEVRRVFQLRRHKKRTDPGFPGTIRSIRGQLTSRPTRCAGQLLATASPSSTASSLSSASTSSGATKPPAAKTFCLISSETSGFSIKKLRAFSLPCPR